MAGGAVRELITKVKFAIDKASLSQANKAAQDVKKKLNDIAQKATKVTITANGAQATSTLARIKGQLQALQGKVTTAYVDVKQRGQKIGEGVKKTGQALADNGGTIAATGAAMVAPLAFPIKTAMEFEAALSSVQAKLGLTKDEMKGVAAEAEKLGAETKFSNVEVLHAADYLAQAGWKEKEIRAGLKDMLQLAIAGDMDLARTADIVSDGLTALNLTAKDTAHFNDIMATAASNSNTNISIMGETFKQLLPVAGALGYSIDDVGLAIELMADKGLKGERAGTSLVAVLNGLAKPTKEAYAVIEKLGVKMFDETTKKALPLKSVIEQLRNSFKSLTDEQKQTYASTIAGVDGMKGLLDIVGATDDRYNQFVGTIQNADGATDRMAKTMHDNAQGAMQDLMSALQGLAKTIGDNFLGAVRDCTVGITAFVQALGEFAKEHPKLIAGVTAAIAIIGGLLIVLGGVGLAISGVATAVGALAPIFTALGGAISGTLAFLSSWGTVFAGIFGGIGSLLSGALAGITGFISSFITSISALFSGGLIGVLTGAFRGAVGLIMGLFSPINIAIMAVIGVILLLKEHWDDVVAWFAPGIESMEEGLAQLASAWENIAPIVEALMPLFKNIAIMLGSVIVGAVSFLWRAFSATFNLIAGVINWVSGLLNDLAGTIRWVADGINGLIDKAKNFIGLKSSIDGVNTSITQKWADRAMGGNTNTQNINVGSINVPTAADVGKGVGSLAEVNPWG